MVMGALGYIVKLSTWPFVHISRQRYFNVTWKNIFPTSSSSDSLLTTAKTYSTYTGKQHTCWRCMNGVSQELVIGPLSNEGTAG